MFTVLSSSLLAGSLTFSTMPLSRRFSTGANYLINLIGQAFQRFSIRRREDEFEDDKAASGSPPRSLRYFPLVLRAAFAKSYERRNKAIADST